MRLTGPNSLGVTHHQPIVLPGVWTFSYTVYTYSILIVHSFPSPLNLLPNLTVKTSDHVYLDMVNDVATLPHYIHLVNVTEVHATIPGESVATGEVKI